jgi:hypothetical protein
MIVQQDDGENIRVEVCNDGALALRDGNVLMACAFDDGKRDGFLRHWSICQYISLGVHLE